MRNKIIGGDFGIIFWLHSAIILFAYLSPFLIDIKFVVVLFLLFYLQDALIKNCVLTMEQFHKRKIDFYYYYFKKFGFNFGKRKLEIIEEGIIMPLVLFIAIVWQVFLGNAPLLF